MQHPSHPGQVLVHFLEGRSVSEVAAHLGVTTTELSGILSGSADISADIALRLAEAFKTEPDLWLRLQMRYDLWLASKKTRAKVKPLEAGLAA
jgi:antitoxin HigA-1